MSAVKYYLTLYNDCYYDFPKKPLDCCKSTCKSTVIFAQHQPVSFLQPPRSRTDPIKTYVLLLFIFYMRCHISFSIMHSIK